MDVCLYEVQSQNIYPVPGHEQVLHHDNLLCYVIHIIIIVIIIITLIANTNVKNINTLSRWQRGRAIHNDNNIRIVIYIFVKS